jgi:hypothetical protein
MPQARARGAPSDRQAAAARRGGGPMALADSLRTVTRRALGQRSLAEQSLILDWPSIVGDDVAKLCTPQGLSFPRRDRRIDGTLTLKTPSGQASRLQHLSPQLIERINGYLGYRAVARLRLLHGAAPGPGERAPEPSPCDGVDSAPAPAGEAIADPALRAALARLGRGLKRSS